MTRNKVAWNIHQACVVLDCLLSTPGGVLYVPRTTSVHWGRVDTSLMSLPLAASTACDAACAALEAYCASLGEPVTSAPGEGSEIEPQKLADLLEFAARRAWQCEGLLQRVCEKAGLGVTGAQPSMELKPHGTGSAAPTLVAGGQEVR